MNKILLQIRILYDKMGGAEKKIATWISENPCGLTPLSITELAERCGCGEATIVRFARRLGFNGYQDMKISLALENGSGEVTGSDIAADDSCFAVYAKVCDEVYCSLEKTKKAIDDDALEKAAKAIMNANKIITLGLGNSASIAVDAGHKFLRAGLNAYSYSDNHMQAIAASHLNAGDVAIGISHSGSSRDIVEALKIAKSVGASTICITNEGKSPILKYSDIVLTTSSDETQYRILGLNSRFAQLAIIDALYYYTVCHLDDKSINAIEDTERALMDKKY